MLSFFSVCGAAYFLLRWPRPQNTGVRGEDETTAPWKICRKLCLTKPSNIIRSSRISTHAWKVNLPARPLSLSLSKQSSRCGLVSMVTIGFFFQVQLSDSSDRKCATSQAHTVWFRRASVCLCCLVIYYKLTAFVTSLQLKSETKMCVVISPQKNLVHFIETEFSNSCVSHGAVSFPSLSLFPPSKCIRGTNKENVTTSQTTQNLYK